MSHLTAPHLTLVLVAKEPIPGKVKTRLYPQYSYVEAANLAAQFLQTTIDTMNLIPAKRRILYYEGTQQYPMNIGGWEIVPQISGNLGERIAHMFDSCEGPTLLLAMDTPHMTLDNLEPVYLKWDAGVDGFLGLTEDGGYWALALANPQGDLIRDVPMSEEHTGHAQLQTLLKAGMNIQFLDVLIDIDTAEDLAKIRKRATI